jgi:hypothetical protein
MPSQDHHAGGRGEAGADEKCSGRANVNPNQPGVDPLSPQPQAAPHVTASERPFLVKADA